MNDKDNDIKRRTARGRAARATFAAELPEPEETAFDACLAVGMSGTEAMRNIYAKPEDRS